MLPASNNYDFDFVYNLWQCEYKYCVKNSKQNETKKPTTVVMQMYSEPKWSKNDAVIINNQFVTVFNGSDCIEKNIDKVTILVTITVKESPNGPEKKGEATFSFGLLSIVDKNDGGDIRLQAQSTIGDFKIDLELHKFPERRNLTHLIKINTKKSQNKNLNGECFGVADNIQLFRDVSSQEKYLVISFPKQSDELIKNIMCLVRNNSSDNNTIPSYLEQWESSGTVYLKFENFSQDNLQTFCTQSKKHIDEKKVISIIYQLVMMLRRVHALGAVFRNINLQNILYNTKDTFQVQYVNFNALMCNKENAFRTTTENQSNQFPFLSPEQSQGSFNNTTDIYAIGILTFILLSGKIPPIGTKFSDSMLSELNTYPKGLDFIQTCLLPQEKRPSSSTLLHHEWFRQKNPSELKITKAIQNSEELLKYQNITRNQKTLAALLAEYISIDDYLMIVEEIIKADDDGDGQINFKEFLNILKEDEKLKEDDIKDIFGKLDTNKDSALSFQELAQFMICTYKEVRDEKLKVFLEKLKVKKSFSWKEVDKLTELLPSNEANMFKDSFKTLMKDRKDFMFDADFLSKFIASRSEGLLPRNVPYIYIKPKNLIAKAPSTNTKIDE